MTLLNRLPLALAAIIAAASPALADYATTAALPPCNSVTIGTALIVSRPPTAAELATSVAGRPFNAPPLLIERDHIACDGSRWNLTATVPLFRGGP